MDFLAFMEERGKENNTYFIDVFIIKNVEVRLIENRLDFQPFEGVRFSGPPPNNGWITGP